MWTFVKYNYFEKWATILCIYPQIGKSHSQCEWPSYSANSYEVVNTINGNVKVLEAPCGDGVQHIEQCPLTSHIQCSTLQNTTNYSCITRIITKPTITGVPNPTYFGLSSQFLLVCAPFKLHRFWFYANEMNRCMRAQSVSMQWKD